MINGASDNGQRRFYSPRAVVASAKRAKKREKEREDCHFSEARREKKKGTERGREKSNATE